MGPLKYLKRVVWPLTFESSLCFKNPHLTPLVKYAKEKGVRLEKSPQKKFFDCYPADHYFWDSSRQSKRIIVPIDKNGKVYSGDSDLEPIFLFAYHLGRFTVKRLKPGICRPMLPSYPIDNKKWKTIKEEKQMICYLEEKLAFANGVEIIQSLNLFDFSDIVRSAEIIIWIRDYLLGECPTCKTVIERDNCPLISKDWDERPRMKTDILDRANRIYDSLTGREGSWKEMI